VRGFVDAPAGLGAALHSDFALTIVFIYVRSFVSHE
jgi:hypothetical protein